MTPLYPPDVYNVEAVAGLIISRLDDFLERHWAADCCCGRVVQDRDGPYIESCSEVYPEIDQMMDVILVDYPLPAEPVDLLRYLMCHSEMWERRPDFSGSLREVLGTLIRGEIYELVSELIEGCYVARRFGTLPER